MSKTAGHLVMLSLLCSGCGTSTPSPGTPVLTGGNCHPLYINQTALAGFSPPGNWIGPMDVSFGAANLTFLEWKANSDPNSITSTSFSVGGTRNHSLEELGHDRAQSEAIAMPVLVSEPTTTLSGQDAWLIVSGANGIVSVSVYMYNNSIAYHVSATGYDLEGTDDLPTLTSIAKTLCLQ